MILLPCPHCGLRNSVEFHYLGEQKRRPDPDGTTAKEWRTYLYGHSNPAGWVTESWFHRAGCRRYLTVERHTVSNEVRASRPPGEPPGTTEGVAGLELPAEPQAAP